MSDIYTVEGARKRELAFVRQPLHVREVARQFSVVCRFGGWGRNLRLRRRNQ